MTKQVTIYSQYQGRRGFYIAEKDSNTRVWIPSGKSKMDEEVFDKLLKTDLSFKAEVGAEDPKIMKHTAKQEKKADDQVSKLEKEKAEMQKKIDSLQGQVNHFTNKSKPGPKPGPKPKA